MKNSAYRTCFIRFIRHISSVAILSILIFGIFVLNGTDALAQHRQEDKTLLVINAYHEDELWSNSMLQPIRLMLYDYPDVRGETYCLNNSAIRNMEEYERMCENLFKQYADKHPSYVVLLGNMSFTLRDRIKKEWGEEIPMLLIARSEMGGGVEEYLSGDGLVREANTNAQFRFASMRNDYNFTAVIVPDFAEETVDMMKKVMPGMKELVFVSDKAYANKIAARDIRLHLEEQYSDVKFRWVQASEETRDDFRDLLSVRQPETGILVSSWVYEIENSRNMKILTTRELSYIKGSLNPIFSLRGVYMDMGCIGGMFVNTDEINAEVVSRVRDMIDGKPLRTVPFFIAETHIPIINYSLLEKYGLSASNCPPGTVFTERPVSFWEKYHLVLILSLLVLLLIIVVIGLYNASYRRQISILKGHEEFLNSMPLAYARINLWLVGEKITSLTYEKKNSAYERVIRQNSQPDNPLHLFSAEFSDNMNRELQNNNGQTMEFNYRFKHTDTYYHFICIPVTKNRKKYGERAYEVDVFAIDLTKDYHMEKKIKDQSVTIDIAMEMAHIVPWQWNASDRKVSIFSYKNSHMNDSKVESSITFEEYLNTVHEEDRKILVDAYSRMVTGEAVRFDVQYRVHEFDNPNEFVWYENHAAITDADSDGHPLRVTGSVQNISVNKAQEEKMAAALLKANESDRLKSAFLANMSHEIRTPLNAIVGFSNLLAESDSLEEKREYVQIINSNNELLLNLINDILDLAKIESNTITINQDICDIHDLVDSVGKTVSIRVPDAVRLNIVHYSDSCIVIADASHITQVLINLLTNATKFTKKGSISVGYEVREDEGEIYFYVKDTGIGLTKDQIATVFDRFVKFNNFVQGSGLGLAICSTLVNKMGGRIGVESAGAGKGSTFWFTIPYVPHEAPLEKDFTNNQHIAAAYDMRNTTFGVEKPSNQFSATLAEIPDGLSILVVEDNPSNFWLMKRLIQDKCTIHHAENGKIGVEMFKELHPDLIVMDINMPEMDGYEAVAEIRKIDTEVPIIAATAYAFPSDRIRILGSGFNAYVSKPVSAASLYEAMIYVLCDRRSQNEGGSEQWLEK